MGWSKTIGKREVSRCSRAASADRASRRISRHRKSGSASALNRVEALESAEPVRRHKCKRPGELIHIDIEKLGRFERVGHRITGDRTGQSNSRGIGWEYLHLAVDDHSRLAYSDNRLRPDGLSASRKPRSL